MTRGRALRSWLVAGTTLATGGAVLLGATDASAFCRSTTVPVAANFQPTREACWDQGVPLFWKNQCVGYSMQRDGSKQVAYEDAANAMSRAFTRWTSAACPTDGSQNSRVSIDVRDLGPVDCAAVKYNQDYGNQNAIIFRDDEWAHQDSSNTLALTTVTFDKDTGEIFDADMEINTHDHRVTIADTIGPQDYDFASIVTHETGHFLGLAHSGDPLATMFYSYKPGTTTLRNLTEDDINAICTVYRPDGTRAVLTDKSTTSDSCDPFPRHGQVSECAPPASNTFLCTSRPGASTRDGAWALGFGLTALGLARARRARTARRPKAKRDA